MKLRSALFGSTIVFGVLIGIFIFFTLRQRNIDHPRPTPRTVEIPVEIQKKFAEPSEKSAEPEPAAAIQHGDSIDAIAFSPVDASLLVSVARFGRNRPIKLWDLDDTSEPIAAFKGKTATFSPNGQLLVISGWLEGVRLWHVAERRYISDFDRFAWCATFSPDGKWVASGNKDIKLWDIRSPGRVVEGTTLSNDTFFSKLGFPSKPSLKELVFSPDGKLLAAASRDKKEVNIWDVERKQVIKTLKQDKWRPETVKFSPDTENPRFALADSRGNIKLYTLPDWNLYATISTVLTNDLAFTPDGRLLVSTSLGGIEFWSVENGRRVALLKGYSRWATSVALSSDGKTLASGGSDNVLRVWHLNSQELVSQDVVRLIYFLPSDRAGQPNVTEKLDPLIKEVQQFYADQMEHHGFGRKTFTFEKNENDSVKVYLVEGQYADAYYLKDTYKKVSREIYKRFDRSKDVHLIVVDVSSEGINNGRENVSGVGSLVPLGLNYFEQDLWSAQAGDAMIPASGSGFDWDTIAHELGHAFGLPHDFRDASYLMSYGRTQKRLSQISAEWLDKSRFFNPDQTFFNEPATIEIVASASNPSKSKVLRFHLKDADGLHQAMLLISPTAEIPPPGYQRGENPEEKKKNWKKHKKRKSFVLHDYRSLNAQEAATVEFNLPKPSKDSVKFQFIDVHGNITYRTFNLKKIR